MSDGPSSDLTFTTVPDDDTPPVTITHTNVRKWTWHPYGCPVTAIQVVCPLCEAPAGTPCDPPPVENHMERLRLAVDVNQGIRDPSGAYR